jgi:SNF2 family DNA or RNA helicase
MATSLNNLFTTLNFNTSDQRPVPILTQWNINPHQIDAIKWMYEREKEPYMNIYGGIAHLEMGLGKTLISVVFSLMRERGRYPTLVVCTKTLLSNWKMDLVKFFGEKWVQDNVLILHGEFCKLNSIKMKHLREKELVITAYPSCAGAWSSIKEKEKNNEKLSDTGLELIYQVEWTRIILDESHNIANPDTLISKSVCGIKATYRMCLTGTPMRNKDQDVLSQLVFLGIKPVPARSAWSSQRFDDLGLNVIILTMTYKDAGIILPDKKDHKIIVGLSDEERKIYRMVEERAVDVVKQFDRKLIEYHSVLVAILMLRQFCLAPILITKEKKRQEFLKELDDVNNVSPMVTWIKNKEGSAGYQSAKTKALIKLLDELKNEKVVVFSSFTCYLTLISDLLTQIGRKHYMINGQVRTNDRQKYITEFNEGDEPSVLLVNYKVGSEGLNLQKKCSKAILTDPWWCSAVKEQALRRVWRFGQEQSVQCYHLVVENSIEERMLEICREKEELAKQYESKMDRDVAYKLLGFTRY